MRSLGLVAIGMLGMMTAVTTAPPAAPQTVSAPVATFPAAPAKPCRLPELSSLVSESDDIEFLLATTPDPRVPRHRRYYDHSIAAIDAGMLDGGFVLERFGFPWQDALRAPAAMTASDDGCYGWMLFRQDRWRDGADPGKTDDNAKACRADVCRRLLFLVPETASYGVARLALEAAIDTIANVLRVGRNPQLRLARYPGCGGDPEGPLPLLIFGPWFSGSVESLARAAKSERSGDALAGLCAVSPSATSSSNAAVARRAGSVPPRLHLIGLAVSDSQRMLALARLALDDLALASRGKPRADAAVNVCEQAGKPVKACEAGEQVAFLTEASVFGKDICPERNTKQYEALPPEYRMLCVQSLQLSFPSNIADLRRDAGAATARERGKAPLKLPVLGNRLSLDESADDGSEFPEGVQARSTSVSAELQLNAALDRLALSHARIVVVVATDVRDRLFLFQEVRARLPEALLVDFTADRLLAHPDAVASSRGALVLASSELLCAQTDDRYCWNVGEVPQQLLFRGQSLHLSAWPTDYHAILAKAVSRIGRPSSGNCPPRGGTEPECASRSPLVHVVGFNGLYSLAGRGSDRNLAWRLVPGAIIGLLSFVVAALWLIRHNAAMQALRTTTRHELRPERVATKTPSWRRRILLLSLPVLTFGLFFQALDYTLNAVVVVFALLLSYFVEIQAGYSARMWDALRNDSATRNDGGHDGHWGGIVCVVLFVALIAALILGETFWWLSSLRIADQLNLDVRALRALALDSGTGLAWFIAVVLIQVSLAMVSTLLLTGLAANARNARLLPNEAPLRDLYERFLDWRDPVIALVAVPSFAVALIIGVGGLRRTVFGDLASAVVLAGITATTIAAMVLLAAQFNVARRVLRLSAYVGHRIALNLADDASAVVPGVWKTSDPCFPLRFPATPVVATIETAGEQRLDYTGVDRLDAWRQQISEDLGSAPDALRSRMPLFLLFASELTIFRGAAFAAALSALASILIVYLFPVTAAGSFIGINVAVLAVAGLLSGLMAVQFERDEVLSNILCNRSKETRFSTALFAYIAFPFVVLAAAIAITEMPGMLDWGGGFIGWLLNKVGAGL